MLTNADLDHVLGLFLLREHGEKLRVHSTGEVWKTLCEALHMKALLDTFCGVTWCELPAPMTPLAGGEMACRAISLPAHAPRYAGPGAAQAGQSVALEFTDARRGARLLVAPDVAAITPELQASLQGADAVLFDGTFWSEDELRSVNPTARTSSAMGHLPISGGSLEALRGLSARRVYMHINNTNPILMPSSAERAEIERAGIAIGEDGMEFEV